MKWLLVLIPLLLVSCAKNASKNEIETWRKSSVVWVNGADVYSRVEPQMGVGALEKAKLVYAAQTAHFDGPLRWQFVAEGTQGEHLSMRVEGIQIQTQRTRRSVNVPRELLGGENAFFLEKLEKKKKPLRLFGKKAEEEPEEEVEEPTPRWMAVYTLPDTLQLFPKADGKVVLAAKIRVNSTRGEQVEWVNFALLPNPDKSKSFRFRQTMIEYDGVPIL